MVNERGGDIVRLGTVAAQGASGITIYDDQDGTTALAVDYWVPINVPAVGDRVLYDVIDGQIVVLQNVSSPARIYTGISVINIVTSNTPVSATITFPAGWFTTVPRMYAGRNAGSSAATWGANFAGASTSGVTLWLNAGTVATYNIWWLAVQQ